MPPTNNSIQQKPYRKHTQLVLLAVLMILLGILAVGYFMYKNQQTSIPIETKNIIVANTTDKFANWKTYKNKEYEFELQYPQNWVVKQAVDSETNIKSVSFETTTNDPVWLKNGSSTAPVFQIEIYPIKQYNEEQKQCAQGLKDGYEPSGCLQMLSVLNKNSKYVFVYYSPTQPGLNASPADFDYFLYQTGETSSKTFKFIATSTQIIDSGIRGKVTIGPTCPVERVPADPNCADKPFQAGFNIKNNAGQIIKAFTSDANGVFSAELPSGIFVITNIPAPGTYPRFSSQNITVLPGKYLDLNLQFDSGLR